MNIQDMKAHELFLPLALPRKKANWLQPEVKNNNVGSSGLGCRILFSSHSIANAKDRSLLCHAQNEKAQIHEILN
jgi:hypothetical protein